MAISASACAPSASLLPREQGAYVQLGLALALGLFLGHGTGAAWGQALSTTLLFLASGPAMVLGHHGSGESSLLRGRALRLFLTLGLLALAATLVTWWNAPVYHWRSLVTPVALASALVSLIIAKQEHTALGELLAAWTLASAAYPVAILGGADARQAALSALTLAGLQTIGTTTVQAFLSSLRRNRHPLPRTIPLFLGLGLMGLGISSDLPLAHRIALAMVPNTCVAAWMLAFPPAAGRLKPIGWALTGASLLGTLPLLVAL